MISGQDTRLWGTFKHFPINMLKIDRLCERYPGSREDMSITRAIIAMARSLGLDIIAEGSRHPNNSPSSRRPVHYPGLLGQPLTPGRQPLCWSRACLPSIDTPHLPERLALLPKVSPGGDAERGTRILETVKLAQQGMVAVG